METEIKYEKEIRGERFKTCNLFLILIKSSYYYRKKTIKVIKNRYLYLFLVL